MDLSKQQHNIEIQECLKILRDNENLYVARAMINPTPEEKVMWKLQFGFDWFF